MRSLQRLTELVRRPIPRSNTLEHHQKPSSLLDGSTITIIIIAIIVVVWATFAKKLHEYTVSRGVDEVEFHATVEGRIRPFGQVRLPGDAAAPNEVQVAAVEQAAPHAALRTGTQAFNENCNVCHGNGIGGAPMLNDAANWEPRVAQGLDTLYQHALEGYTSATGGYMPPKGGRLDFADEEVTAAVDYMLSQLPQ